MEFCEGVHLELRCEHCDTVRISRLTLDQVEYLYQQGRIGQDHFEAYSYVHQLLSPYRPDPAHSEIPAVVRIADALVASARDRYVNGRRIPA